MLLLLLLLLLSLYSSSSASKAVVVGSTSDFLIPSLGLFRLFFLVLLVPLLFLLDVKPYLGDDFFFDKTFF